MKFIYLKDEQSKKQGLQGVKSLASDTILVFENVNPGEYFHTYNCLFNIDIVPIDCNGLVLGIWNCNPGLPKVGPMPLGTNAVLESNGGWFKNRNITEGVNIYHKFIS